MRLRVLQLNRKQKEKRELDHDQYRTAASGKLNHLRVLQFA